MKTTLLRELLNDALELQKLKTELNSDYSAGDLDAWNKRLKDAELLVAALEDAANASCFYVKAHNEDGESLDLIVNAANKVSARKLWRTHFELDDLAEPQSIGAIPMVQPMQKGVINWDDMGK